MSNNICSIIIVNYKVKEEVLNCIKSIFESKPKNSFEIIVVDNEGDQSLEKELAEKFDNVKYIKSLSNKGYGAGNNLGANEAKGNILFFLNPDTIVKKRAIDSLISFFDNNNKVGIAAPLLLDENETVYPLQGTLELNPFRAIFVLSFINKVLPNNPISKKYWLLDWNKRKIRKVDVVPGTAFMIKKIDFEKIGGFDENFFLYFEEHDFCKRAKDFEYNMFINPNAQIIHKWGKSTKNESKDDLYKIYSKSKFLYFKKHYGFLWALFIHIMTSIRRSIPV